MCQLPHLPAALLGGVLICGCMSTGMRRYSREPEALLNPKRKTWEKIAPELVTDASECSPVCLPHQHVPFCT